MVYGLLEANNQWWVSVHLIAIVAVVLLVLYYYYNKPITIPKPWHYNGYVTNYNATPIAKGAFPPK
jgi:uncharacterized membrane protein